MKAFDQFLMVALVAACSPFYVHAQHPCLRILTESQLSCTPAGVDPFPNATNLAEFHLGEPTLGLDQYPNALTNPRYKAFWIFGDGNFRDFPDGMSPAEDLATHHQNYAYSSAGIYHPIVVLIEKKSNTTPPPSIEREINIPFPSGKAGFAHSPDTFVTTLSSGDYMSLRNSERNRPNYPTAFVSSAERADSMITGMFFFFNSLKIWSATDFEQRDLHDLSASTVRLPDYFNNQSATFKATDTQLPFGLNTNLSFFRGVQSFKNFVYVSVSDTARLGMPSNFSEIRIFPVLKTQWDDSWIAGSGPDTILPMGQYLAVSVGDRPRYTSDNDPGFPAFRNLVGSAFSDLSGPEYQISTDPPLYIRGLSVMEVEMTLAIDPNELEVEQVCPFGPDSFQVKMRLQVCNEGAMHVSDFTFRLTDHSKLLGQPSFPMNNAIRLQSAGANEWKYEWKTFLDGVPLPSSGISHDPSLTCATANLILNTDWRGVNALAAGTALELCVKFPFARDTCSFNFGFENFCPEQGYQCGDCPSDSTRASLCQNFCCHWIWLLIILVLIVLLVQLWTLWVVKSGKKKIVHKKNVS